MPSVQFETKIDSKIKGAISKVCNKRGLKIDRFVEEALIDKLEEIEDLEDLPRLRTLPTRSLDDFLKDLKMNGKI